jgi:hypothetical protein
MRFKRLSCGFLLTLTTLCSSCALGQGLPAGQQQALGSGTVRWGDIDFQASASRLRGVHLHVERSDPAPQAWAFVFTVFDDLDGDELPSPREVLAVRQALGSQAGKTVFPSLRWSGKAVRPLARLRFQDGGTRHERTVAL